MNVWSKCRNTFFLLLSCMICISCLSGCGEAAYLIPYNIDTTNSSFTITNTSDADKAATFASDLCVANEDVNVDAVDMSNATAAGLFSIDDGEVLYAKNIHKSMYPASLTKVMTALLAMKYGSQDDVLTASSNVVITESGAQVAGIEPGDTMTLDQALRIMLLYSANDAAVMIAEQYGDSVDGFATMMNDEARSIGATESNFVNPNGLNDANHYVSAYDMYLIFNEACKYDLFREIISMSSYSTVYYDEDGDAVSFDKSSTNQFITGAVTAPTGITVIGGKTGTTTAAGHCLIILASDTSGKEYIAVVLQSTTSDDLYEEMVSLLGLINQNSTDAS